MSFGGFGLSGPNERIRHHRTRLSLESLESRCLLAVTFVPQDPILDSNATYPKSIFAADFDGDNDADIVVASYIDNRVAWFENLDGQGTYGEQQLITETSIGASSVYGGDIDGDGDIDIVSTSADTYDADVSWYENLDGQGTFSEQRVISADVSVGDSVHLADIDGDGDLDVLSASRSDTKVAWYPNLDGAGDFGEQEIISDLEDGATSVVAVDVDGDNDMDVISGALDSDTIKVFINSGDGSSFEEQVVNNKATSVTAVFAADVDGDGDPDIVATSRGGEQDYDNTVSWFANENGQFGSERIISVDEAGPNELYVGDIDGDNNLDVVVASRIGDRVAWYQNVGGGVFGAPQVIEDDADGASTAVLVDVDGDQDLDLFWGSRFDNKLALQLNTDGAGTFSQPELLTRQGAPGAQMANAADLDGDGDLDVLTASFSNDQITWSENLGGGRFGPANLITDRTNGTEAAVAADLDGDGDLDVASSSYFDDKVSWYENLDGQGTFGPQRIVSTDKFGPEHVFAADLDGDEDIDLLSVSRIDSTVVWFENLGNQGLFTAAKTITDGGQDGPSIVRVADLDGDGDLDVMSNGYDGTTIAWYENLDGLGDFSEERLISAVLEIPTSLEAADFDGDGDLDVVAASGEDDRVLWFENTDGLGQFGEEQVVSEDFDGAFYLGTADFDDDGDIDVIAAGIVANLVGWYENDGSGNFSDIIEIDANVRGATSVVAADLDGDGRIDAMATSSTLDRVTWYRNVDQDGPLKGDFNEDAIVNDADIDLLCKEIQAGGLDDDFDLTGDGSVNQADVEELVSRIMGIPFGDSDLNGVFDSTDFVQVFTRGQYEDSIDGNSGWADGDWNCDGDFTSSDLVVAFQRGGYTGSVSRAAVSRDAAIASSLGIRDNETREEQPTQDRPQQLIEDVGFEQRAIESGGVDFSRERAAPEVSKTTTDRLLRDAVDAAFTEL